jgi:drug/metabolite transporter superfamily protein YnfA
VDPPDHESWVTLSTYDMQHASLAFIKSFWEFYTNLRDENRFVWTLVTIVMCLFFANIGTYFNLLTLIFIILNGAFIVVPLLSYVPKEFWDRISSFLPTAADMRIHFREQSLGPNDSLMLDSENIPSLEEESEDEFMFDPTHFDSSSSKSSSASGSFEVI